MAFTDSFRQHHTELLAIAGEIAKRLNPDSLKKDATEVRSLLSKLAGKLSVHLTMEDNSLYPTLIKHADASVRVVANSFVKEMGGIKTVFTEYTKKWGTASAIQNEAAAFVKETKDLFAALAKRIEKENNDLYSLVDRLNKK